MTDKQWEAFCRYKKTLKSLCNQWLSLEKELIPLQKEAAASKDGDADYPFETPVVYNTDYDKLTKEDEILIFVVGDNPGKEEQLAKNQRYLCGQSGRLAAGFFSRNPDLKCDFRKNTIILNKTPIHTAKTSQLKDLIKNGSVAVKNLIIVSQKKMAELTAQLHQDFVKYAEKGKPVPELWLVGYSELRPKKVFVEYRETLKKAYSSEEAKAAWEKVFVYQHFSMNRFQIDLKDFMKKNEGAGIKKCLEQLGHLHRDEIFN